MHLLEKLKTHWQFIFVLLIAFLARLLFSGNTVYMWDEERDWLPLARQISFNLNDLNLPIRGDHHNALSGYLIKFSGLMFGESHIGFRFFDIVAGVLTVAVVYRIALAMVGATAGFWAALLLALNEYHISVSSLAIQKSFYLLAAALSILFFYHYLTLQKRVYLYLMATFLGIGFLIYAITVLLIPVFAITLFIAGHRDILKRRETYISSLIFIAIVSPDIFWNFFYSRGAAEVSYSTHLSRVGKLGLSEQPLVFFINGILEKLYEYAGSRLIPTSSPEYLQTNSIVGAVMLLVVLFFTIRFLREEKGIKLLVLLFWFVFVFFTLNNSAIADRPEMDRSVWYWIDVTLLPACILTGVLLSKLKGWFQLPVFCGALVLTAYIALNVSLLRFGLPWAAVRFVPEFIFAESTPQLVSVRANFDYCDFCSASELKLVSVGIVDEAHNKSRPAEIGVDIVDAELGTPDDTFRLLADTSLVGSRYKFIYEVTDRWGRKQVLDDYPWGAIGVRVATPGTKPWVTPFWVKKD